MLLETGEISQDIGTISNLFGYWDSFGKTYYDVISSFFPTGVGYAGNVLLGEAISNGEELKDSKIGLTVDDFSVSDEYKFIFQIGFTEQSSGTFYINFGSATPIQVDFDFGVPDLTISSETWFTVDTSDIDEVNKIITITFYLDVAENSIDSDGIYLTFTSNSDIFYLKQFKINDNQLFIDLAGDVYMDCSDYVSFVIAAKQGLVIRQKLFNCAGLINENYDFVESSVKIVSNKTSLISDSISDMIQTFNQGDIIVFKKNTKYHCILILDNSKYTECCAKQICRRCRIINRNL